MEIPYYPSTMDNKPWPSKSGWLNQPSDVTSLEIVLSFSDIIFSNGWYITDITVSFNSSDALSGIADCDNDVILSEEGVGMSASGPYEEVPKSPARRPPLQIS